MSDRLKHLIEKIKIDEPNIVASLERIAKENPLMPLGEVWLRARRESS